MSLTVMSVLAKFQATLAWKIYKFEGFGVVMKRFLDPLAVNLNFSKIDIGFLYLKILNIETSWYFLFFIKKSKIT